METTKITPKVFIDRVLGGTAIGIIVGLIPNADLAEQAAVTIQNFHPSASLTISVTGPLPI